VDLWLAAAARVAAPGNPFRELIESLVTKSASVNGYPHGRLPTLALYCALCAALLFATASHGRDDQCDGWSAWQRFKRLYLSELIVGSAPRGFAADWIGYRLLPLLARAKLGGIVQAYRARVEAESLQSDQHYHSDALTLFGLGWLDRRYAFDRSGVLLVKWTAPCGAR
jgi:endo-1,4-beta-D-glucanase Y